MSIPKNERWIIHHLNLHKYAKDFSVPEYEACEVFELDNTKFSLKAIESALKEASSETILELLKYPANILAHNNTYGRESNGGLQDIHTVLSRASYSIMKNYPSKTKPKKCYKS